MRGDLGRLTREWFTEAGRVIGDLVAEAAQRHPAFAEAATWATGSTPDELRRREERRAALMVFGWPVDRNAPSVDEVKRRYTELAKVCHPDRNAELSGLFEQVTAARDVLLAWASESQ